MCGWLCKYKIVYVSMVFTLMHICLCAFVCVCTCVQYAYIYAESDGSAMNSE